MPENLIQSTLGFTTSLGHGVRGRKNPMEVAKLSGFLLSIATRRSLKAIFAQFQAELDVLAWIGKSEVSWSGCSWLALDCTYGAQWFFCLTKSWIRNPDWRQGESDVPTQLSTTYYETRHQIFFVVGLCVSPPNSKTLTQTSTTVAMIIIASLKRYVNPASRNRIS